MVIRTLKYDAWGKLQSQYWLGVLILFIYYLLIQFVPEAISGFSSYSQMLQISSGYQSTPWLGFFRQLLSLTAIVLISGPLNVGLAYSFTELSRGTELKVNKLFYGFKFFGKSIAMGILTNIFVFLWSLLFIVPGIIKLFAYKMAPYILADNPDMTGLDSISESKNLMDEHKVELFLLHLSFIGWYIGPLAIYIIGLLTNGIALIIIGVIALSLAGLFVSPYLYAAEAEFYRKLIDEDNDDTSETDDGNKNDYSYDEKDDWESKLSKISAKKKNLKS